MKKLLALLMALIFVFSFAACSSEDKKDDKTETTTVPADVEEATKAPEKADLSVYNEVLEKYRAAKKDYDDNSVIDGTIDYNLTSAETLFGNDLQYLLCDITGDGAEELIVATAFKSADAEGSYYPQFEDGAIILNIWTEKNGKAEPLFKDTAFGYKTYISTCESNIVEIRTYSGGNSLIFSYYDVSDTSEEPAFLESFGYYENYTTGETIFKEFSQPVEPGASAEDGGTIITEDEYSDLLTKYAGIGSINWNNL